MKQRLSAEQINSLKVLGFTGMAVVFFLFHIWFRTWVVTKGYEVGQHREDIARLESELMRAKIERSRVMGPDNLERWAKHLQATGTAFGAPQPHQLIYLNP